jgi:thymidine phosphorylase
VLAQEVIRRKRDGHRLTAQEIAHFVGGLADGGWSDSQAAALAMAVVWRGMDSEETAELTRAMTRSGDVLSWADSGLQGPLLDKHSTGGVGDKVSLLLAPIVAACGGIVPMISGRGLGHTGGTLDKLEALPGYRVDVPREQLLRALRRCGCAIIGASRSLAPADRRLYAIRDVTATVESLPLITASILSKKLAAGLEGLVLDVKVGNGAFVAASDEAQALARSLVEVAGAAGLKARALITDMSQPLGWSAGNALEVREAIDFLKGVSRDARLEQLTLALSAELLELGGLAPHVADAARRARRALDSGAAAERFARMVAELGGPADVLASAGLPQAAVCREVPAREDGCIAAIDTRAIGLAVVELGGGRRQAGDAIDPAVGFSGLISVGERVQRGQPLAQVHAASEAAAARAEACLRQAYVVEPGADRRARPPVLLGRVAAPRNGPATPETTGAP